MFDKVLNTSLIKRIPLLHYIDHEEKLVWAHISILKMSAGEISKFMNLARQLYKRNFSSKASHKH